MWREPSPHRPRLIVISQAVSDTFVAWLRGFASAYGDVELWTGSVVQSEGASIRVFAMPKYDRSSRGSRLATWLRFTAAAVHKLLRYPRDVPVLAITNPPFMPLILVMFRVFFGRKYGIIEYDIYPQIMAEMGLIRPVGVIHEVWWRWHGWSLRRADLVIAISEVMADELLRMSDGPIVNLVIVPTWTDTERIRPISRDQNPFASRLGLGNEICVIYSGNLGATHAIETIIEVAQHLNDRTDIRFVIIGEGAKRGLVEQSVASGRVPNISLLPIQDPATFPTALACADVAFVTLATGYERLSLPSKTYDMMAAGCAVLGISPARSDLARILEKHKCGRNFPPDQASTIVSYLLDLVDNKSVLEMYRQNARHAAVEYYSAERCGTRLTDAVVAHLCNDPGRKM